MGLTLQDIFDCESGYRNPIIVGELPNALRVHLGLRVPQVHLSRESLGHIKARHPDIDNFDLCFLPLVIERGAIMQERAKPQVIVSAYKDTESHRQYAAIMKVANVRCEVWLTSFHRVHSRQLQKWRKRHIILRDAP
jgi:hypothetical protein